MQLLHQYPVAPDHVMTPKLCQAHSSRRCRSPRTHPFFPTSFILPLQLPKHSSYCGSTSLPQTPAWAHLLSNTHSCFPALLGKCRWNHPHSTPHWWHTSPRQPFHLSPGSFPTALRITQISDMTLRHQNRYHCTILLEIVMAFSPGVWFDVGAGTQDADPSS